jgi:hypothetical protein
MSVATTGTPAAMASTRTSPKLSWPTAALTNTSAAA